MAKSALTNAASAGARRFLVQRHMLAPARAQGAASPDLSMRMSLIRLRQGRIAEALDEARQTAAEASDRLEDVTRRAEEAARRLHRGARGPPLGVAAGGVAVVETHRPVARDVGDEQAAVVRNRVGDLDAVHIDL